MTRRKLKSLNIENDKKEKYLKRTKIPQRYSENVDVAQNVLNEK